MSGILDGQNKYGQLQFVCNYGVNFPGKNENIGECSSRAEINPQSCESTMALH